MQSIKQDRGMMNRGVKSKNWEQQNIGSMAAAIPFGHVTNVTGVWGCLCSLTGNLRLLKEDRVKIYIHFQFWAN